MDVFGLSDVIKRRKRMLDSIDGNVSKPVQVNPSPSTGSPPFDQKTIDEIQARKKRLNPDLR